MKKDYGKYMLYGLAIILIVALIISVGSFFGLNVATMSAHSAEIKSTEQSIQSTSQMNKMSLTSYDKELARQMMDKNNDGKCDACGMPVEMCMDSGQLQCNTDPESTIGVLGSQHIHADWKVYINGNAIDFTGKDHMTGMRSGSSVSSFIHVDSGAPTPEKTGDVLHMHATGVPLWIFFDSIKLELPESTKVYVNGKLNSDGLNYVFKDLGKILVTDGQGDLAQHLSSITDYAKNR